MNIKLKSKSKLNMPLFKPKLVSIEVGSQNIKVIQAKYSNKKVVIDDGFIINIPENSYTDGNINNIIILKKTLESGFNVHKLSPKKVVLTSKSTSIVTREIVVPSAKSDEMKSLIKFQIERYLPIMPDDYIIQYKNIENFAEKDVKKSRIRIVAYPKIMSEQYLNLCKELKLTPYALDINSNAISKLFCFTNKINEKEIDNKLSYGFIDLGHDYTTFTIIKNGNVNFTRIIDFGGSYVDIELSKQLMITEMEASKEKEKYSNLSSEQGKDIKASIINDTIKQKFTVSFMEIERMIQFFKNKNSENKIEKIYIYGGGSKVKGIDIFMKNILSTDVEKIESMDSVVLKIENLQLSDFINAAGAVIRFNR